VTAATAPSPASDDDAIIQLQGVKKIYGQGESEVRALAGIDFEISRGDFVAIMGASGSGKSTCMNILGCLDVPTAGTYRLAGVATNDLHGDGLTLLRRHYIGFVFQGFNLLSRTSALENVELPLVYRRVKLRDRRAAALRSLELVGLSDRADHTPKSCPAVSSNESPSRAPWSPTQSSCSLTSRPATSIQRARRRSWSSWSSSTARAGSPS